MKKLIFAAFMLLTGASFAQSKFEGQELSINGFRSPSIGLEYRYHNVSVHAGYYITAFKAGETTEFFKAGVTTWFWAVDDKPVPSSFYSSTSYARGLTRDYKGKNALMSEIGFRWMVYKGLNLRLGVASTVAKGQSFKVNPTPGISYGFFF